MVPRKVGTSWEVAAPAKLNLYLEVLGKRTDGFHELETLLVPVQIYDDAPLVARLQMLPDVFALPSISNSRSTFAPSCPLTTIWCSAPRSCWPVEPALNPTGISI